MFFRTEKEKTEETRKEQKKEGKKIIEDLGDNFTSMSGGGLLPSFGTDTVPAMLTPGEFVMSRGAVSMFW